MILLVLASGVRRCKIVGKQGGNMDAECHRIITETLAEAGFEYEVRPTPQEGQNPPSFDIVSETSEIEPSFVINAIHAAAGREPCLENIKIAVGQKHRLTFEDLSV